MSSIERCLNVLCKSDELNPNVSATITYANGTVCHVLYTTEGSPDMGKEYYEMHGNGVSARCDDFNNLIIKGSRGPMFKIKKGLKGQLEELSEFAQAISYYKDYLSHYGTNPNVLNSMGECYYKLGNKEEALITWEKSLKINPNQEKLKKIVESIKEKK